MNVFRNFIFLSLMITIHLIFSYNLFPGWWYSGIGTVTIISIGYYIWEQSSWSKMGLKLSRNVILHIVVLAVLITVASALFLVFLGSQQGVVITYTYYGSYIHDIFYALNEEILLGALLLFGLKKRTKLNPLIISTLVALVFASIHFVFYKYIFLDRGILTLKTLTCLFFVGVFRNNLILQYRHIGYSWAFHFGWVAIMFGSHHFFAESGVRLTEPERFNTYLGSTEMLITSLVLLTFSLVPYFKKLSLKAV